MSGTSVDGLDIVLCEVNLGERYCETLQAQTIPYPDSLSNNILNIAHAGSVNLQALTALSYYLGEFSARCVERFCGSRGIPLGSIDLIGSHGQTISHLSQPYLLLGNHVRGTLQIGEAEIIAKRLGITTVSDFRSADIALGGSGAPLVPVFHHHRFAKAGALRVVVNIGGIANLTLLDGKGDIAATDTGPGNCLIDGCSQALSGNPFDAQGKAALSGRVNTALLRELMNDETLLRPLPTTYDRGELYQLVDRHHLLTGEAGNNAADVLATVSELTVATIANGVKRMTGGGDPETLLICGGGVHNDYLMTGLRSRFGANRVISTETCGSNPDYVEAEAFAYLANLTVESATGNVPAATGARRQAILGKISQP